MVDKRKPAAKPPAKAPVKPRKPDKKKTITAAILFFLLVVTGFLAYGQWFNPKPATALVVMETSMGVIELELYPDKAPDTVRNFLQYVKEGFYDGTVFHRVVNAATFKIVQGGGFTADAQPKTTHAPIKLETSGGLKNKAWSIAMARTSIPDSATSQFYFNLIDHSALDASPGNLGYAVFGKITQGTDVVGKINGVATGIREVPGQGNYSDWPTKDVVIQRAYVK